MRIFSHRPAGTPSTLPHPVPFSMATKIPDIGGMPGRLQSIQVAKSRGAVAIVKSCVNLAIRDALQTCRVRCARKEGRHALTRSRRTALCLAVRFFPERAPRDNPCGQLCHDARHVGNRLVGDAMRGHHRTNFPRHGRVDHNRAVNPPPSDAGRSQSDDGPFVQDAMHLVTKVMGVIPDQTARWPQTPLCLCLRAVCVHPFAKIGAVCRHHYAPKCPACAHPTTPIQGQDGGLVALGRLRKALDGHSVRGAVRF